MGQEKTTCQVGVATFHHDMKGDAGDEFKGYAGLTDPSNNWMAGENHSFIHLFPRMMGQVRRSCGMEARQIEVIRF